ncbi:MAG: RNA polymerase sigma-70 factor [Prevotellaceae bacterium]|jgi:RNA polymerase sigma-70 factor (ECF subfamily)|nr:RNA polymerase sigma-70 factor [Prevotellaceae bacterium]
MENTIGQLREGDHRAYEAVFKSWYAPLCSYACSMLRCMDEAEDVVQKMFCVLWDQRAELDVRISLQSYLYRAVHNRCLNRLKHEKVREKYKADVAHRHGEAYDSADGQMAHDELAAAVEGAVAQLPEQCRIVFELSRKEALTYPEIAERLKISHNTVENHISKALRVLREKLKEFT